METFVFLFQLLLFIAALGIAGSLVYLRVNRIRKNILLGKPLGKKADNKSKRWKNMFLIAFGQKKMFERPIVGLLHLVVYAGFLIVNIEVLEIVLDGLTGKHRIFNSLLGGLYPLLIGFFESVALLIVFACLVFLIRRNILGVERLKKVELKGFPSLDANTILIWEIVLMGALYIMNATDTVLQTRTESSAYIAAHYPQVGSFAISGLFTGLFTTWSDTSLIIAERFAWWIHILGIMAFAVYVTYSKHLHIALAFPNTFFAGMEPKGYMTNMPSVTSEVKIMMGLEQPTAQEQPVARFGAKDVTDLSWKNLLDAYTCTECGRCTSVCPANHTGKLLSPRKIMMDTRDRAEELGQIVAHNQGKLPEQTEKSLYGDFISKEELMACTSCNACAEACPVNINPLSIILQMRRYIAMEESATPAEWNLMFNNLEVTGAPWAIPGADRFQWAEELKS